MPGSFSRLPVRARVAGAERRGGVRHDHLRERDRRSRLDLVDVRRDLVVDAGLVRRAQRHRADVLVAGRVEVGDPGVAGRAARIEAALALGHLLRVLVGDVDHRHQRVGAEPIRDLDPDRAPRQRCRDRVAGGVEAELAAVGARGVLQVCREGVDVAREAAAGARPAYRCRRCC